jgi:hypothetical protein
VSLWRTVAAGLLALAAVGALVRSIDGNVFARFLSVLAALSLAIVAIGIYRAREWALGAAFLIAIFWFWAVLALRVQGVIGAPEFIVWIAWAVVEMVATVRARPS